MRTLLGVFSLFFFCLSLQGCGTVIGLATDATIAVVKIPFKVAGAVIDGVSGDDDGDNKKEDEKPSEDTNKAE